MRPRSRCFRHVCLPCCVFASLTVSPRRTYTDIGFYNRLLIAPAGARPLMKEGRSRPSRYHSYCDDYYVNMNLNTEMDLPTSRETVLHFFEQVKKTYPAMRNFY